VPSGRLVLLPSPLLGPAVFAPLARVLRSRGRGVEVIASPPPRDPAELLAGLLGCVPDEPGLVLVPHSNAGLYAAALAGARDVQAVVFLDAALSSELPSTPAAPPGLRALLARLSDENGLLPPWTRWWPDADVDELFPDAETRRGVEAEQPRLPLGYFDADVPTPRGRIGRAAYLAFGDTYAEERAVAEARGWPVATLPGRHLHQLVDPDGVADAVSDLLRRLGLPD
jgi:hypothetical protein